MDAEEAEEAASRMSMFDGEVDSHQSAVAAQGAAHGVVSSEVAAEDVNALQTADDESPDDFLGMGIMAGGIHSS